MGYDPRMESSPLMLLLLPVIVAAVPVLLWEPRGWQQLVARIGVVGLALTAWIDLVDNVGAGENDPPLLSASWALFAVLIAAGALATLLRRRRAV